VDAVGTLIDENSHRSVRGGVRNVLDHSLHRHWIPCDESTAAWTCNPRAARAG
jgi:hypothetical protein